MKTSELKKIVEENGLRLVESDVRYCVVDKNYTQYADTIKTMQDDFRVQRFCPKVIAQAILDYAYTPLEEREEEKKYWLVFPKAFHNEIEIVLGKYSNGYDCCGTEASKEKFKVKFTQKEIDEMPFDTKFFEKVEVK